MTIERLDAFGIASYHQLRERSLASDDGVRQSAQRRKPTKIGGEAKWQWRDGGDGQPFTGRQLGEHIGETSDGVKVFIFFCCFVFFFFEKRYPGVKFNSSIYDLRA